MKSIEYKFAAVDTNYEITIHNELGVESTSEINVIGFGVQRYFSLG